MGRGCQNREGQEEVRFNAKEAPNSYVAVPGDNRASGTRAWRSLKVCHALFPVDRGSEYGVSITRLA